jgi:hypothetical protein
MGYNKVPIGVVDKLPTKNTRFLIFQRFFAY